MAATEVRFNGFFRPDFKSDGRVRMRLSEPSPGTLNASASRPVPMRDARLLQALADSEAGFFAQRGFVLLPHISAVADWDSQNEVAQVYLPEIDSILRNRLLPGRGIEIQQWPSIVRRGAGTKHTAYGTGVHADLGLTPDDYQENIAAFSTPENAQRWRDRFEAGDVVGFLMVNFWRTTNMAQPLKHMPLAICDPTSVDLADTLPIGLLDFTPTGKPTNQIALRQNRAQRWYWYPEMTGDELLAFKIFEYFKGKPVDRLWTCFHSAFADPHAPKDAPLRQSCEHRVGVFCLKP